MKITGWFLVVAGAVRLCVCSDGYKIDPNLPDGHYRITLGQHEHEEPVIKRWEPVVRRWMHVEDRSDDSPEAVPATVVEEEKPTRALVPRQRPTNKWCDHGSKYLHYMGVPSQSQAPWEDHKQPKPAPPHRFRNSFGQGTGEYTFVVDEETQKVEDVALDLSDGSVLPFHIDEVQCMHRSKYPTLQYALEPADYYASKQALFNWCSVYDFHNQHVELALRGNVAVYVCQHKHQWLHNNHCSESEYEAAEAAFNSTCGDGPAWAYIGKWKKRYGRAWKGDSICGRHQVVGIDRNYAGVGWFDDERDQDRPPSWDH